jgi:hypothetical protein
MVAEKSLLVVRCSNLHSLVATSYLTRYSTFLSDFIPPGCRVSSFGCGLFGCMELLHECEKQAYGKPSGGVPS